MLSTVDSFELDGGSPQVAGGMLSRDGVVSKHVDIGEDSLVGRVRGPDALVCTIDTWLIEQGR